MLSNTLESFFEDYFNKKYSGLTPENPKYIEIYREELKLFAAYLVNNYSDATNNENYWVNRANKKD